MENLFLYLLIWFISFFPILIWGYIFSYIDNDSLNKKRFFVWLLAWAISVVPILYMEKILDIIDFKYLNTFYFASNIKDFFTSLEFWFSLAIFILLIAFFSFLFWWFIKKIRELAKIYLKNILVFLIFILIFSVFIFLFNIIFNNFSYLNFRVVDSISFWDIAFNSFKLIIFYYLVVAFIEEASKYFNFLQSSVLKIKNVKDWVLYAIFVALWFSLIENMLYLYNYYINYWFNSELIKIYFLRSAFSIIVHVLSSSVVAYYYSRALILYRNKNISFNYLKIFWYGLAVSILLHLVYDVALTLGFWMIMFVYFIVWYFYVSGIFYKE